MSRNRPQPGLWFSADGEATLTVWAPETESVVLHVEYKNLQLPLRKQDEAGYWQIKTSALNIGDRYKIAVDDAQPFPDVASLSQPDGVHGASEAIDITAYQWNDTAWKNPPMDEYIIYELHTGTFTPEGTFDGIISKLPYLKSLGINAIEVMPVAQFPGGRNWGYDGVFPYAVQDSYGGAEGLQRLVDACHAAGIAVVLDVVYNHLGPEGAYLGTYGPYFTEKYKTPWGNALNFDDAWCDGARDFFVQNAAMWFKHFHVDALRLDAVHAIKDFSVKHLLQEIKEATNALVKETGRTHHLIVELDLNDTRFINPIEKGGYGMDAQWVDEFHHALRVTAGGSTTGYYSDFAGIEHLAKAYNNAYVYDGQWSPHRSKHFGIPTENNGAQFIVFSQNHDQVGNRMLGERTSILHSFEMQKTLAAAVFLSPFIPMLFMGEEWSEPHPFLYFVSHTDPELAEAVRKGRKAEFAAFHAEGEAPDPVAEETFERSKLQWHLLNEESHQTMLRYYQELIELRKSHPVLKVLNRQGTKATADVATNCLILERNEGDKALVCLFNFSTQAQNLVLPQTANGYKKLWDSAEPKWTGPQAAPEQTATNVDAQPESVVVYERV